MVKHTARRTNAWLSEHYDDRLGRRSSLKVRVSYSKTGIADTTGNEHF
jgi:hypothetical protein